MFIDNAQARSISAVDGWSQQQFRAAQKNVTLVAFGDSNTTPWLPGTKSWFRLLENNVRNHYSSRLYNFTFTNLAVNGTTISPNPPGLQQYDLPAALNQITYADYGFVLLGTNDAWEGLDIGTFQSYLQQFIMTIKNSAKVGKLYILAVTPMIFPYNCIGPSCWNNTHNPQTERVVPMNNFLSTIGSYCVGIGFNCAYINTNNGIQLSAAFLNPNDGIHLLNTSQAVVSNNIYGVLSHDTSVMAPCGSLAVKRCM